MLVTLQYMTNTWKALRMFCKVHQETGWFDDLYLQSLLLIQLAMIMSSPLPCLLRIAGAS